LPTSAHLVKTKLGIEICYDIQHPESTRELAIGGAEIVFNPYCTDDFSRPLLVHLYHTRALENCLYIARVNFSAPRNSGTSSIIHYDGFTQDELDSAEGVLVSDLNLTALTQCEVADLKLLGKGHLRANLFAKAVGRDPP
jgi:predicted amidohydrolase